MRVGHADETALFHPRHSPGFVSYPQCSVQHRLAKVELLAVVEDLDALQVEPRVTTDPEVHCQPVGEVDDALVLDRTASEPRLAAVVQAGDVGAGIVDAVGNGLRRRTAGSEVAISQRAQCFPQPLASGIEPFVPQRPFVVVLRFDGRGGRPSLAHGDPSEAPMRNSRSARSLTTTSAPCSLSASACELRSTPMTRQKPPR